MRPALIGKRGAACYPKRREQSPLSKDVSTPKKGVNIDTDRSLKPEIGTAGREAETISYNLPARKLQCVVKNAVSPSLPLMKD